MCGARAADRILSSIACTQIDEEPFSLAFPELPSLREVRLAATLNHHHRRRRVWRRKVCRSVRARLPRESLEIVLFNDENRMVFHPLLACGRPVNMNAVPGMSDHAFALKCRRV